MARTSADGERVLSGSGAIDWRFEDRDSKRLRALAERYRLDEVVAGADGDFAAAQALGHWVKTRWPHDAYAAIPAWDAEEMLERAAAGEGFYCVHYVVCLVQLCQALGLLARIVNIHPAVPDRTWKPSEWTEPTGIDEHCVAEVWCGELGKWILIDPDFDLHYRRGDAPLSALEVHEAVVEDRTDELSIVTGPGTEAMLTEIAPATLRSLYRRYRHIVVFARNNHLSDPDGPTQVVHWVDDAAEPLVYWDGSDMRHWPGIIGPSWAGRKDDGMTARLTDGDSTAAWASEDSTDRHWAEVDLARPARVGTVQLVWPVCRGEVCRSRRYRVEGRTAADWRELTTGPGERRGARTCHAVSSADEIDAVRVVQESGGGHEATPDRLWLAQIEVTDV